MEAKQAAPSGAYLTPAEFAERLKISLGTARNMIAAGELRVLRFRRRVRIPLAEVERFERRAMAADR